MKSWQNSALQKMFLPQKILTEHSSTLKNVFGFLPLKSTIRDLNILKNAKESHEHRAKVAETFITFLTSEGKDEIAKAEMAKQAAIAMFQRVPSGYLTKDQIEPISHPLAEILLKRK